MKNMKKVKLTGKLSLNKETIAKLNQEQMNAIIGGDLLSVGCGSNPPTAQTCSCDISICCTSATTCC